MWPSCTPPACGPPCSARERSPVNGWRRQGRGAKLRLVGVFDQQEAALLRGLIGQVRTMLGQRADDVPVDELAELTGMTS
ncbi:MAG TPA: DUF2017 family protein, partial [Pseudonocardia sp.]|nr:DUF2017 family protein [Pseudonocardia sp.]